MDNNPNNMAAPRPTHYKVFAAPGIDSPASEFGVFNSGAGRAPNTETGKVEPYDWRNDNPTLDSDDNRMVGNFGATASGGANRLAIRRRGLAPFGGFVSGGNRHLVAMQHSGGIVDHNAGADHFIAGGPGAASTFCRVNIVSPKTNRGAKLPVLPPMPSRGGVQAIPGGGGSHEPLTAPLQPKISGWPTIFNFSDKKANSQ